MTYEEILTQCAYKEAKELTLVEQEVWQHERAISQLAFFHFLKWVRIIRPPRLGYTGDTIIPFTIYDHTRKFIANLLTQPLISLLKARQIYASTTIAAYVLWTALGKVGANNLLFSKGQPEAKELLAKARRIYDLLPNFLRLRLDPDSTEELGFPSLGSSIKAFPSTASAGISYTATIVVADEHAEHPYADENYISSKPTRDAGGQFISIFTEDPYSNDNLATAIFTDAMDGNNDFVPLFFPWNVVPDRDNEWYERTKRNIPDRELGRLSPELYMAKNYPSSIEEALSLAESVVVFDKKVLNALMEDVRGQINYGEEWGEIDNDICHIYKDYHFGKSYIAGADVGQGVGADESVLVIMDSATGDIVADIKTNKLPPEQFAYHSVKLLNRFHNPYWWIEHNITGGGREVIKKAVEMGYRKLGYRGDKPIRWSDINNNETLKRVGIFMDEATRADLFGSLIPGVNDFQIRTYNRDGLRQFYSIVRNANKKGKIEAVSGQHDDYVMAVGICNLKKNDARADSFTLKPIRTLDFRPNRRVKVYG